MRNRLTIAALLILGLAAGAAVLIAARAADLVESASKSSVERTLGLVGLSWVEIHTNGLQVILTGTAPDEATRFRALREAGTIVDAARLIDEMDVAVVEPIEPPRFSVEILRNDDGLKLIGLVPKATGSDAVAERVRQRIGGGEVADLLDEADFDAPEGWDRALDYGLAALGRLERSKISITAGLVEIGAISESAEQKQTLERELRGARPPGLRVILNISAPRPVVTPFTLRFIIDERGARFDACTTDNENGRKLILSAARSAGLTGRADCTLGLGVPSPHWDRAAFLAIEALSEIGGGSVTFSDADVTLIAAPGTDDALFDRVTARLKRDLPEVFSLKVILPELPPEAGADAPQAPPQFIATLDGDGQLQLRGGIADDRARAAILAYARAKFGGAAVTEALRLRDDIPRGWPFRIFASLDALAQLQSGQITTKADTVRITGQTGREGAVPDVARILSTKLGTGADFEIDIAYVEELDPMAHLPTPEECVGQIGAVLSVQKISFAPGSADIDEVARASIENIAEILKQCEGVPMEVGGHTDSQGREIMNKELSQARADAVVNALLARRVLTSGLTAVGYGEEQPIADNDSEDGREANRRIEFRLIGAEELEAAQAAAESEAETPAEDGATTGDDQ